MLPNMNTCENRCSNFSKKYQIRDNEIARVTKSINVLLFCTGVGELSDVYIFKLTARAQSIYREDYVCVNSMTRPDKSYMSIRFEVSRCRIS